MSSSPAEPHCKGAAPFAFEVNEIATVFITLCDACTYADCRAWRTDKFFRLKLALFFLLLFLTSRLFFSNKVGAFFHPAEVGLLAFKANVERALVHRVVLQVIVEEVVNILKPRMFFKALHFASL